MPTILADTFTASLAKLNGQEQKQAKLTAFDLQTEPDRPGLQFHRIDKSKDPNFWSVRVNSDIRIIVHKTGASLLLAYVGHHDEAYTWAERRRIEQHPKTGAVQIVEVRERVEEITTPPPIQPELGFPAETIAEKPLPPVNGGKAEPQLLFPDLGRDELLSIGVPEDWISDVLEADEDHFLAIADHLPREATEALLEYVSSGVLKDHAIADVVDPFAHPDTMRRFRVIENQAELEEALAYPWDRWTVFLHPAQRDLAVRDFAGPARVTGSAGTGKTVVALHRAARLARESPSAKILLATFSDPLANALQRNLAILAGSDAALLDRIVVASFQGIAEELYMLTTGHKAHIAARDIIRSLLKKAVEAENPEGISEQFALSEWINVVDAWQVPDAQTYAATPRLGRRARLGARQREIIWPVFQGLRKALADRRLMTLATLFAAVTHHYASKERKPFDHILIDEAQDLGVPELRFFSAIAHPRQNSLFFAGDLGQRIFQLPFSWVGLGVDVRGRSFTLKVNYRTSHQIRTTADRLLPKSVRDADGVEDERTGTISLFNGAPPQVTVTRSSSDESDAVAAFVKTCLIDGIEPQEIALFVRSREELPRARAALTKANIGWIELVGRAEIEHGRVAIGTMHFAKGLEFKAVVVMACDETIIPSATRLSDVGDELELDEVYATERQLLYVAMTRARDRLLVSAVDPASEFLADLMDAARP